MNFSLIIITRVLQSFLRHAHLQRLIPVLPPLYPVPGKDGPAAFFPYTDAGIAYKEGIG